MVVGWGDWKLAGLIFIRPVQNSTITSARFYHKLSTEPSDSTERYGSAFAKPTSSGLISGREINTASAFQFCSNLILIGVRLQVATVPVLPTPVFASTPQRTMMTKRIENPAAVHGRQNEAKPERPLGFVRKPERVADRQRRTGNGQP